MAIKRPVNKTNGLKKQLTDSVAEKVVPVNKSADLNSLIGQPWWKIKAATGTPLSTDATKEAAASIYYAALSSYDSIMREDKEQKFLRIMVNNNKSGTLTDRVSALVSLSEQSGPLCLPYIKKLVHMLQKKNVRESLLALEALRKLYSGDLMPSSRKLQFFEPSKCQSTNDLLLHYFEDSLKTSYAAFVQVLIDLFTKQSLPVVQNKVLEAAFELLRAKPEQEKPLLSLLVSGLGEKVEQKSIPSKTNLLLRKLCVQHERMKEAVVAEVRNQHFNLKDIHAVYYPCVFLYGLPLDLKNDGEVAGTVVQALIHLVVLLGQTESDREKLPKEGSQEKLSPEFRARLLRLALEGLERAFAVATESSVISAPVSEQTQESLLRLSYETSTPGLAATVLSFVFRAVSPFKAVSKSFLRAVYHQCGSLELLRGTGGLPFVKFVSNLLSEQTAGRFNAKILNSVEKIAFARRLLQTALHIGDPVGPVLPAVIELVKKYECEAKPNEEARAYDPKDRDYSFAGTDLVWECSMLPNLADESARTILPKDLLAALKKGQAVVLGKAIAPISATDLLSQFTQPEKSKWSFGKAMAAFVISKKQKKASEADEEIDAAFEQELAEGAEDAEELEEELEDGVDELLGGSDFGESLDDDLEDEEDDLEDELEDEEDESDCQAPANKKARQEFSDKARKVLKKYSGSTFVSAEELDEYLQ